MAGVVLLANRGRRIRWRAIAEPAGRFGLAAGGFEPVFAAREECYVRAACGESPNGRPPDPRRRPGDDDHGALR